MITLEVLIWLILGLIIITVPIIVFLKQYAPILFESFQKVRRSLTKTISKEERESINKTIKSMRSNQEKIFDKEVSLPTTINESEKTKEIHTDETDIVEEIIEEGLAEKLKEENEDIIEESKNGMQNTESEKSESNTSQVKENKDKHFQKVERIRYAALTYKERGKMDQYEKKLVEGLALEPKNSDFLAMLSTLYFSQGNEVKALSLLKRSITLNPENHKAIRQVGQIYRQQNNNDAARVLIEKAISLKPDNPKYLISLVELHYEGGELKESISVMEKLSKLRPTNIDYVLTLATLHEEIKEPTNAEKYYMKALEINPLNEPAKKALKRLR